jgi:hypothetical protein
MQTDITISKTEAGELCSVKNVKRLLKDMGKYDEKFVKDQFELFLKQAAGW